MPAPDRRFGVSGGGIRMNGIGGRSRSRSKRPPVCIVFIRINRIRTGFEFLSSSHDPKFLYERIISKLFDFQSNILTILNQ